MREEFKNPVITTNIGKENREPLTHTSSRDHCAKVKPPEAKINVDAQFDENFEVVPQSLDDILNDRPVRMEGGVSQRFTLAVSNIKKPREIPGEFKIPPSMSRMSFYSHRPRVSAKGGVPTLTQSLIQLYSYIHAHTHTAP